MKTIDKFICAALGVLCLAFASCKKEGTDPYSAYVWTGEYPVTTQNGSTGKTENKTGVIMLQFQPGGNECIIYTGIAGLLSMNRRTFDVQWSGDDNFALYRSSDGQPSRENELYGKAYDYRGTISGEKMSLRAYIGGDSIAAIYELSRKPLR